MKIFPDRFLLQSGKLSLTLLWLLCLSFLSACQIIPPAPPPQTSPSLQATETNLPQTAAKSPAAEPTPSSIPNGALVFTVVGISPDETLPLYQEPEKSSPILSRIPSTGNSIPPALEGPLEQDAWLHIQYQGTEGWADRSHLAVQRGSVPEELIALGQFSTAALRDGDYGQLADLIHPQHCLRFAPYPYLHENDQRICLPELSALWNSDTVLLWGRYDGSGEPIELTFQEYQDRFVYDQDYFQPQVVGFNREVSSGNAINNIPEIYPDGIMVEYYFPGFDPQYGGMDWRSLRLVFINQNGHWYLVAVVHGEWTI